jgi:predicted RND superfamily exporter protein
MVPLVLTSIMAEALMVMMGVGVKVATLPVVALGVGIGVDYAIYILAIFTSRLKSGASLADAYVESLRRTGKVVLLTGFTLCLAVLTWVISPIKLQADMGLMLAFMFLFNMINALILIPAVAYYLYDREGNQQDA